MKVKVDSRQLDSHYHGPYEFDFLVPGDGYPSRLRKHQTPPERRWTLKNHPLNVIVAEWYFPKIGSLMDQLTILANHPRAYQSQKVQGDYYRILKQAVHSLASYVPGKTQPLGIIRAGAVVAKMLHPNCQNTLFLNMKRLPFKDGRFRVGIIDRQKAFGQITSQTPLEIDEVVLASGLTLVGLIRALASEGHLPKTINVIAPFLTQPGAEWLLQTAADYHLRLTLIGARLYWHLDQNLYVLEDQQRQAYRQLILRGINPVLAVGDAGDLLDKFLPANLKR